MQTAKNLRLSLLVIITGFIILSIFSGVHMSNSVLAQLNAPKASATTMIGNVTIPGVTPHVKYNNVSSTVAFNKENTTASISPTGISTQLQHLPPAIENTTNNATMPNITGTNATTPREPSVQK
jgi:hypothetical protein